MQKMKNNNLLNSCNLHKKMFPNVNHKNKKPNNPLLKTILVPMSCLLVKLNPPKFKRNLKIKWPN